MSSEPFCKHRLQNGENARLRKINERLDALKTLCKHRLRITANVTSGKERSHGYTETETLGRTRAGDLRSR